MGWTKKIVEDFLGKRLNTVRCGSVPKGDDPDGLIIHDYS